MNPRDFLNLFRTKTGKLLLFGLLFASALFILSAVRDKQSESASEPVTASKPSTNHRDKPQVVQTVQRAMELFRPPPPKSEPSTPAVPTHATGSSTPATPSQMRAQEPLAPISLFGDSAATVVEPKRLSSNYAPYGRLIPCETIITVDSASIQTPIIGLITEDIYHAGRLVIPAGTEVHGTAQTDRHRERIASGGSWTLVWQTGEELRLKGVALDREFANGTDGWGITDGSAGLRGHILKSDDLAEIKLFAATFLSGAASALTEKEQTLFGSIDSRSLNNAPLKGAEDILKVYAQRIQDTIARDGFYVRVPSGKQFYLYTLQTIDRAEAVIGNASVSLPGETETRPKYSAIERPLPSALVSPEPIAARTP